VRDGWVPEVVAERTALMAYSNESADVLARPSVNAVTEHLTSRESARFSH
jgi:hypothetical protein